MQAFFVSTSKHIRQDVQRAGLSPAAGCGAAQAPHHSLLLTPHIPHADLREAPPYMQSFFEYFAYFVVSKSPGSPAPQVLTQTSEPRTVAQPPHMQSCVVSTSKSTSARICSVQDSVLPQGVGLRKPHIFSTIPLSTLSPFFLLLSPHFFLFSFHASLLPLHFSHFSPHFSLLTTVMILLH